MAHTTDSDNNFFVNSTLDDSGFNFVNDVTACLNAAIGSSNYAMSGLPSAATAATPDTFNNVRIEWRPQGVGESLSGAISLSGSGRYFDNDLALNANARLGMFPFNSSQSDRTNTIIRNAAGLQVNAGPNTGLGVATGSMSGVSRLYGTFTQNELIFVITRDTYAQFFLSYQGVVRNIAFPFSGSHPKGCVSFQAANIFSSLKMGGNSIWTDNTARALLMSSYTNACTVASGQTFGTDLWMTDFMFRFNASNNNNPIIGTPKNLKLAIGTSVTPGTLYEPTTPVDSGSNLWLCIADYPTFTNGKLMLRVRT